MAGDWIKMRADLHTHPKVVRILSALNAVKHAHTVSDALRVVGALHAVWCVFDTHSDDGYLHGYMPETMDAVIGWPGFTQAMIDVGWAAVDGETLVMPGFSEHNGQSAKRRAQETRRKQDARSDVRNLSAPDADKKRSREEKRRSKPPIPPVGGIASCADAAIAATKTNNSRRAKTAIALTTFLENCRSSGEKPIPEGDSIFDYAAKAGIPNDILLMHWQEFKARYCEEGAKHQKDWRAVYRNSVRGNWYKLWRMDGNGACTLTTVGEQAKRAHMKESA
ncbi:UNVERIFIED_ORG: hypothetical protein ABIC62_002436 [Burkholderia sp. 1595]|uniref:Uncharacterized protein n=1 Tax=Paraburkholderia terricola TaxID=169427 RepID=A0ABU1LSK1_9BURK|nr:hypothetical protein [Paraburkholderia terricola]MDR6409737.1 hypothetical protein [Paraburkholderia terricola]